MAPGDTDLRHDGLQTPLSQSEHYGNCADRDQRLVALLNLIQLLEWDGLTEFHKSYYNWLAGSLMPSVMAMSASC